MLADKELTYPGATETARTFEAEDWYLTIDGRSMGHPSRLRRTFSSPAGTNFVDVLTWYRDQLVARGWTVTDFPDTHWTIEARRRSGRHDHTLRISSVGQPKVVFDAVYDIAEWAKPA
jgi:hypothetical protein